MTVHIGLYVDDGRQGSTQAVEVEELEAGMYRILHSPGFVEGVAAGDIIRLTDSRLGHFEVVKRGGNVCVRWAVESEIAPYLAQADELLEPLGARRDGNVKTIAVWTIPVTVGLPAIESAMHRLTALAANSTWWYGNVYDDDNRPLNWWLSSQ